jgi:hypothetical protein
VSNTSGVAQNAINLPKGGGAIKGIGETFQPNLFTGTGNHAIPLAMSPGRNDFGPKLSLEYSSGNGNGLFGLGWQLSIPRVTRKTEKGLPHYDDTDVFVLSGAEDLVPCLQKVVDPTSGQETWVPEDPIERPLHTVHRYRPRTEGLLARIERWEHNATHDVHWRTITKDNITSIYGGSTASRISDPDNAQHVYEWLLQETLDATGNHILYGYAKDNPQLYANEDPSIRLREIFEQNRSATQLYIRRIYYGNLPEPLADAQGNAVTYADGTAVGHLRDGRRQRMVTGTVQRPAVQQPGPGEPRLRQTAAPVRLRLHFRRHSARQIHGEGGRWCLQERRGCPHSRPFQSRGGDAFAAVVQPAAGVPHPMAPVLASDRPGKRERLRVGAGAEPLPHPRRREDLESQCDMASGALH